MKSFRGMLTACIVLTCVVTAWTAIASPGTIGTALDDDQAARLVGGASCTGVSRETCSGGLFGGYCPDGAGCMINTCDSDTGWKYCGEQCLCQSGPGEDRDDPYYCCTHFFDWLVECGS